MDNCLAQCWDKQTYSITTTLPDSFWMMDLTFSVSIKAKVEKTPQASDEISNFHWID